MSDDLIVGTHQGIAQDACIAEPAAQLLPVGRAPLALPLARAGQLEPVLRWDDAELWRIWLGLSAANQPELVGGAPAPAA